AGHPAIRAPGPIQWFCRESCLLALAYYISSLFVLRLVVFALILSGPGNRRKHACGTARSPLQFPFPFPQSIFELRKKLQGIIAENLLTDTAGVLLKQVASVHLFSQYLGETASGEFRRPVNSLSMVAVGPPHDLVTWHHLQPFM